MPLCCLQKAERVEKHRLSTFPMVFGSASICFLSAAVCWARAACRESGFRCADRLPDVLGAENGCQRTLLLSISPGPHFIGKHGSSRRTETFSSSPIPLQPPSLDLSGL